MYFFQSEQVTKLRFWLSDGARCLKVGLHEKRDLPEVFHERCTREFGGKSRALLFQKTDWIWDWRRCNFPAVLEGLHVHFSVFS